LGRFGKARTRSSISWQSRTEACRLDGTVLGDTVNVVSWLERLNREAGALVVVSDEQTPEARIQ
jgi:class 3 adenylate cyclase